MDLRPTGSEDELLFLQTESLTITLKGSSSHPDYPGVHNDKQEATVRVKSREDFSISLPGDAGTASSICTERFYLGVFTVHPLFFEQQQYELFVEPTEGRSVSFWHENYYIRNAVSPVGREQRMLSGVINFRNDIGFSDLVFAVDGKETVTITLEVFPSKISYKEDYQAIVSDVTTEVYNLVFDFLRKTYSSFDVSRDVQSSPVEFFAIIRKIYDDFIRAADMILRSPHHQLLKESKVLPPHKVKQADAKTLKWLRKHPEEMRRTDNKIQVSRALTTRKFVTYDTRENRLTKYMLEHTARRLENFRETYCRIKDNPDGNGPDAYAVSQMNSMIQGIQRRCHTGFMKDVNATAAESGMSLVFSMAMGYRDLYRCYLLLQHGLAITGGIFNLSVKDLALLYEYWCFIKLNSLLKNKNQYRLVSQDVIRINGTGLAVSLVKGQGSRVRYYDEQNGDQIVLSYNPSEKKLPTVNQRPDNVLSLTKRGGSTEYEYIFDAKYRMDPSLPGTYYHQAVCSLPGPKEEDINTMHRYRDAIVSEGNNRYERGMVGAYVLFPYANEDEYRNHRFFKSIDKVNIGGLPFLPTATKMVSELLDDLIDDSPDSAFERATLPRGIENKLAKVNWNRRDVLIGTLRFKEQLDICINNRFYYLPTMLLPDEKLPIHTVAIYQSRALFGAEAQIAYYGEVKRIQKVKRWEIKEVLCNPGREDEDYYRIEICAWRKLARPIQIARGIREARFTNEFLLKHSENSSELLLKNEEEYRLLTELKRFVTDASVINDDDRPQGFAFGDHKIVFQDGKIKLIRDGRMITQCEVKAFMRRPNAEFREMMKMMKR